jgi:hypothetical protein
MRQLPAEPSLEFAEERDLSLVDLAPSFGEFEPSGAINFGKLPDPA